MVKIYNIIPLNNHLYMVDKTLKKKYEDNTNLLILRDGLLWGKEGQVCTLLRDRINGATCEVRKAKSKTTYYAYTDINYCVDREDVVPILASTDTTLGLPLLPKVEEEDILSKAEEIYPYVESHVIKAVAHNAGQDSRRIAWVRGYKAASVKKYTEEDMREAFIEGTNHGARYQQLIDNDDFVDADEMSIDKDFEKLIQSLTPKPIAVEVEMLEYLSDFEYEAIESGQLDYRKATVLTKPKTKDNMVVIRRWIYE